MNRLLEVLGLRRGAQQQPTPVAFYIFWAVLVIAIAVVVSIVLH